MIEDEGIKGDVQGLGEREKISYGRCRRGDKRDRGRALQGCTLHLSVQLCYNVRFPRVGVKSAGQVQRGSAGVQVNKLLL